MLMFRMLAGGLPFDRSVAKLTPIEQFLARAEFYQSIEQMPGPKQYVPSLPEAIDAVVRKAISLTVRDRYANAGEMLEALKDADSSLLFILSGSSDSTVDEHYEETTEMDLEPESEEASDEFGPVETKVDAVPYGAGTSDESERESSFDESLTTNPIDAVPKHLQPVAGRTISPMDGHPSTPGKIMPQTLPPSVERGATADEGSPRDGLAGDTFPSYPVINPSTHTASTSDSGAHPRQSPAPSMPTGASPGRSPAPSPTGERLSDSSQRTPSQPGSIETPPSKGVEPFGLSSLNESSAHVKPEIAPSTDSSPGEDASRDDLVPPTHRQRRPTPSGITKATVPPRRRSPMAIVAIVIAVIVALFGLTIGGLYVTWWLDLWGRDARQPNQSAGETTENDRPLQPDQRPGQAENQELGRDIEEINLEIHSQPPGAAVILDGQRVGTTPYHTSMHRSDTQRQLTVRAEGYVPIEQMVHSHESQRLEFDLQPTPSP
jgi:hypothetical protein